MPDLGTREALARLLWAEMAAAGHRQCDVAAAVGITEKHLSQIVNLRVSARPEFVDAILAACGRRLVLSTEPITEPAPEAPDLMDDLHSPGTRRTARGRPG